MSYIKGIPQMRHEVMHMIDLSKETIEELFFEQIKQLSLQSRWP